MANYCVHRAASSLTKTRGGPKWQVASTQLTASADANAKCNVTEVSGSRANDFDKLTAIKPLKSEIRVN